MRWLGEGMAFVAETASGHLLAMDGAPEAGGRNLAPRPMETLLAATGACSASDVVAILKKSGQEVSGCEVVLEAERAEAPPRVFTRIRMRYRVRGRALRPNLVEQAVRLSHEKYCSASAMLAKSAEIGREVEIVEG